MSRSTNFHMSLEKLRPFYYMSPIMWAMSILETSLYEARAGREISRFPKIRV